MRSAAPAFLPIFRSPHQADLLTRLFVGGGEVTLTKLARDLGIAPATAHREIQRLEDAHLLVSRRVGRTRLISADRAHPGARALTDLLTDMASAAPGAVPHAPSRLVYRMRPAWRPRVVPDVFVPADLNLLTGPTSGLFDPPVELFWQPGRLDFAHPIDLARFYSSALRVAQAPDTFAAWIDRRALADLWPCLALPSVVRRAWETIHPQLRTEDTQVNARIVVQDTVLAAIGDLGFALAGGSALIDYDIVVRESEDIDAFVDRLDPALYVAAAAAVIDTCEGHGWGAELVLHQDFEKRVKITVPGLDPIVVQMIHYPRSAEPQSRAGGGLRLIFSDVVGGKAAAIGDAPRGRDFDDIAHVVETAGWDLDAVVEAMVRLGYPDRVGEFWTNIAALRRGDFDDEIRAEGFDPAFSHAVLDDRP